MKNKILNLLYTINILLRLTVFIAVAVVIIGIGLLHNAVNGIFGTKWWENPL